MRFGVVPFRVAKSMVESYHYSETMPRGRNLCFGVWIDGGLYAVAVYGNGINCYQAPYLSRVTGFNVTNENHVELKRLVRVEPRHKSFQLTQLLGQANKWLVSQGYTFIVSFSDPSKGHEGCIYKAANFAHIGFTQKEYHDVDAQGKQFHRRKAYRHAKYYGIPIAEARKKLGLRSVPTPQRKRWFLALGKANKKAMSKLRAGTGASL